MSALYMLLGTLVALGVLVTFHEFGHFWVARRCGVKVLRFSVGFGKPLVRWYDRQGTEFVIAMLPLGGYVKMLDEREAPVPDDELSAAFNRKTVKQRMAIVAAGPAANFILAFVFFVLVAVIGSQQAIPVIGQVAPDSLAEQAGLQVGQEITAINGREVRSWSDVNMELVRRLGETGLMVVSVVSQGNSVPEAHSVNLDGWLKGVEEPNPFTGLGITPWRPKIAPVITTLDENGPGAVAGLQAGDQLIAVAGQPITDWYEAVEILQAHPNEVVTVQWQRDGQILSQEILLQSKGDAEKPIGYLGVGVDGGEWPAEMMRDVRHGPLDALKVGLVQTWNMSAMTLQSIKKMLLGELSVKNLSGPITIAKVAGASAQSGLGEFLTFLAYLSISLGVLNLLPIPVLDGGHLLFYIAEWIRGKPVPERAQAWGIQLGISLVFGLMLLAIVNDLGRL